MAGNRSTPNARPSETLPSFREAYRKRRCILPVDGFFEWKAIKGQKAKQPYAIAMKDRSPFGIAGLWENWRDPTSGEWVRTSRSSRPTPTSWWPRFTTAMPLILAAADYARWLSEEPKPARPDEAVPGGADADVADLDARQQAGE